MRQSVALKKEPPEEVTKSKKPHKLTKAQIEARKWQKEMVTLLNFRRSNKAIHGDGLSKRMDKSKNYLVKVLGQLVLQDGEMIGSSMDGYFFIRSEQDRQIAIQWLKMRGFKTLLRCAIIAGVHVEDIFREAWGEYWDTRRTKAVEKNLSLGHVPKKAVAG